MPKYRFMKDSECIPPQPILIGGGKEPGLVPITTVSLGIVEALGLRPNVEESV